MYDKEKKKGKKAIVRQAIQPRSQAKRLLTGRTFMGTQPQNQLAQVTTLPHSNRSRTSPYSTPAGQPNSRARFFQTSACEACDWRSSSCVLYISFSASRVSKRSTFRARDLRAAAVFRAVFIFLGSFGSGQISGSGLDLGFRTRESTTVERGVRGDFSAANFLEGTGAVCFGLSLAALATGNSGRAPKNTDPSWLGSRSRSCIYGVAWPKSSGDVWLL